MKAQTRIGLIGPDHTQPCGIADYTARLSAALRAQCDLAFAPYREAMGGRLDGCAAILVQYERSLMPRADFLDRLSARYPGKVFVVPHEVYGQDPFAFPYSDLRSAFPPVLWGKRLRYRWLHRDYAREQALQARGYDAFRVIPLSGPNEELLRRLCGEKVLPAVPHAYFRPPESPAPGPSRADLFPPGCRTVFGIFGFLNPAQDYGLVLELIRRLGDGAGLLVLGGERAGADARGRAREGRQRTAGGADSGGETGRLLEQARSLGVQRSVQVTGYLAEASLWRHFALCDAFLSPLRFKSNSGSLLHLIHAEKPILASDLPLTRWLREQGCPFDLFADAQELEKLARAVMARALAPRPSRYPWSFAAAADAYLDAMAAAVSPR